MQAIKTVQLTKKYKDVTAVDGLDLTARQGELFALLGVNGAGKTTTIKMLTVGLSMMCYRLGKEKRMSLGDRQLRGRMGKLLYCLCLTAS